MLYRMFLLLLLLPGISLGAPLTLTWNPSVNADGSSPANLVGYTVRRGTVTGTYTADIPVGNVTTATIEGPPAGGTYYYAVQATDTAGNKSDLSNEVQFPPAVVTPFSLTVTPTTVAPGGSLQVSWAGIATPQATDWWGFYAKGASNGAAKYWRYVNCTQKATTAVPAGSCPMTVAAALATGAYEVRMFAADSLTAALGTVAVTVGTAPPPPPPPPTGVSVDCTISKTGTDQVQISCKGSPVATATATDVSDAGSPRGRPSTDEGSPRTGRY